MDLVLALKLFALIIISLILTPLLSPVRAEADLNLCLPDGLTVRRGSPNCWASYSMGLHRKICIRREIWMEYLKRNHSICGIWKGRWRIYSPPQNEPGGKKIFLRTFYATSLQPKSSKIPISNRIESIREKISILIARHDPQGILRRLIVDERTPGNPHGFLRILGFVHLISATGIHLYALQKLSYSTLLWITKFMRLPVGAGLWIAGILSNFLWISAWTLEGLRPGMLRPWLIVSFRSFAQFFGIRWFLWAPLALAMGLDLGVALVRWIIGWPEGEVGNPWAPGRVHYALAVGGGLMAIELMRGTERNSPFSFKQHFALSVGSWLPTAVYDLICLKLISFATPILSLLTIPFFTLVTYPGILIGATLDSLGFREAASTLIFWVCHSSQLLIHGLVRICTSLQLLWVVGSSSQIPAILMASVALIKPSKLKFITAVTGIVLLRFLVLNWPENPKKIHKALWIHQLDVGQGDSALVKTKNNLGLIDVGSEWVLSEEHWIKLLAARESTEIKWIALTHFDGDHSGGLKRLAPLLKIGCVTSSQAEWNTTKGKILASTLKKIGIPSLDWNQNCFPFPVMPPTHPKRKGNNSRMSALAVPLNSGWIYLNAGDSDRKDELRFHSWLKKQNLLKDHSLIKISHHGSRRSSSELFLKSLHPKAAWISAGANNSYGHPNFEVLKRLVQAGIPIYRTDQKGYLKHDTTGQKSSGFFDTMPLFR